MNNLKLWWLKKLSDIQRSARRRSLNLAIKEARRITDTTDKKVLIYLIKGEYVVLTKQELKRRWKDREFVGYTIQELEKHSTMKTEKKLTAEQIKALQAQTDKKKHTPVKK